VASLRRFAQDRFVLAQLAQDFGTFAAELVRVGLDFADEGIEGVETVLWAIPLRRRKTLEQVRIPSPFLDEESHGVLVGREKLKQWFDAKFEGKLLDGAFVARKCAAVHIDVVAGIFPFDHDVHRGCHWHECSAARVVD
jgi:hypothetical protein